MHSFLPRRFLIGAYLVFPLAVVALGLGWALLVLEPLLPDRIAAHWNLSGLPDGFDSPTSMIIQPGLILGSISVCMGVCTVITRIPGLGSTSVLLAGFMVAMILDTLLPQRGLSEAEISTVRTAWLPGVITMMLALVLAFLLQQWERRCMRQEIARHNPQLRTASPDHVWESRRHGVPWLFVALSSFSVLFVFVSPATMILVLGITLLTMQTVFPGRAMRIELSDTALLLRSPGPLIVLLSEIKHADALENVGFWDAGGYGIRLTPSELFVVPQSGNAVRLMRHAECPITIVVPEGRASDIADLINARISSA